MNEVSTSNRLMASLLKKIVYVFAILTILLILFIVFYILLKGIPHINVDLFSLEYNSENLSLVPALVNTLNICLLSLLIGTPIGIGCAIYMREYASKKSRFVKLVRITVQTLSGIPSIVYGLFGYLFFVVFLDIGFSLLSGALTLSIMILPIIITSSEEALRQVSDGYREGSFAVGAGKLRTIMKIILPASIPMIATGVILSVGRIVGETVALIYTAGTVAKIAFGDSGRTLAVHMYALWNEGLSRDQSYATGCVLLLLILLINIASKFLVYRFRRKLNIDE